MLFAGDGHHGAMPDAVTSKSVAGSAYDLDLEMSLLLASSAPAPWSAAVTESARILAGRPWMQRGLAAEELCTLALLLFARTYAGERLPHEVPLEELRKALDEPSDREPRVIGEIDRALTATGQRDSSRPHLAPLEKIFNRARNQYLPGASMLADDIEPPAPGPSPMRRASQRLVEFLSTYTSQARQEAAVPEVGSGPLVVEARRIEIVTGGSVMRLQCPDRPADRVSVVRVDGPHAMRECEHGHASEFWQLEPARVRLAVARATGARPSVQGAYRVEELLIVSSDVPRHSDPHQINWFLRDS